MAEEALEIVRLKNDFFRDGFYKVMLALGLVLASLVCLVLTFLYLFLSKPSPIEFQTADNEWRILAPVSLDKPYTSTADLLQWVSRALPDSFDYDFINYMTQLKSRQRFFTQEGWKRYLDLLNNFANFNTVQTEKQFINATASGAPFIINQGILQGRYAWWVQMPINVSYSNVAGGGKQQNITFQVLVVRVPTLNNLDGIGIENIIVYTGNANQAKPNG